MHQIITYENRLLYWSIVDLRNSAILMRETVGCMLWYVRRHRCLSNYVRSDKSIEQINAGAFEKHRKVGRSGLLVRGDGAINAKVTTFKTTGTASS